ncbi:MAG TPA: hypothetical protein VLV54_15880 [Thermoanaerobaculia bacterium]|nr:hypothetical protein [Thermoanaerobaculia bacterium]
MPNNILQSKTWTIQTCQGTSGLQSGDVLTFGANSVTVQRLTVTGSPTSFTWSTACTYYNAATGPVGDVQASDGTYNLTIAAGILLGDAPATGAAYGQGKRKTAVPSYSKSSKKANGDSADGGGGGGGSSWTAQGGGAAGSGGNPPPYGPKRPVV